MRARIGNKKGVTDIVPEEKHLETSRSATKQRDATHKLSQRGVKLTLRVTLITSLVSPRLQESERQFQNLASFVTYKHRGDFKKMDCHVGLVTLRSRSNVKITTVPTDSSWYVRSPCHIHITC